MSAKDAIKAREVAKRPQPIKVKSKAKTLVNEPKVVAEPVEITEVPKGPDGES